MASASEKPQAGTFRELRVLSVYDRRLAFEKDEVQELYPLARAWAANDPAGILHRRKSARATASSNGVENSASSGVVDRVTQLQQVPLELPPLVPSTPSEPVRAPKIESSLSADDILPKHGKMSRDEEDAFRRRIKEQFVTRSRAERRVRAQAHAAATAPYRARLAQVVPHMFGPDAAPVAPLHLPDLVAVAPMPLMAMPGLHGGHGVDQGAATSHHGQGQGQGGQGGGMHMAGGRARGGRATAGTGRGRGGKGRTARDSTSYDIGGDGSLLVDPSTGVPMPMAGMMQYEQQLHHMQGAGFARRGGARSSHAAMADMAGMHGQYYASLQPYTTGEAEGAQYHHPHHASQGYQEEGAGYDASMQWAAQAEGGWGEDVGPDFLAMLQTAAEDGTIRGGGSPAKQERGATPAQGGSGDRGQPGAVHGSGGSAGRAQAAALVRLTSGAQGSPGSASGSAPRTGAHGRSGAEQTGGSPSSDGAVASTPAHGTQERQPVSSGGQGSEGSAQRALESMTSPGGAALPQLAELLAGFGDMPT